MTTTFLPRIAVLGLLSAAACQPPVVQAHIEPQPLASRDASDTVPGNLTVTGTATLEVTPNAADVKLDLTADAASPRAAVSKLRASEASMRTHLEAEGVEADAIAVSTITLNPTFRWDAHGQQQIPTGYQAKLCVTVQTEDFTTIPGIVEAGAKAGVTQSSTTFHNTEMTALKAEVRDMALQAAKAKAEQFRDALDLDITRVVSVSEAQAGMAWSAYGAALENAVANVSGFAAGAGTSTMQAETLPLTLTVTVAYALG